MTRSHVDRTRDRGAVAVVTALVGLAIAAATLLAMVTVAGELVDHQRARTAADAAALAGVVAGRSAAESVARSNGASIVAWSARPVVTGLGSGTEVVVTVAVGDRRATARASNAP